MSSKEKSLTVEVSHDAHGSLWLRGRNFLRKLRTNCVALLSKDS